MVWCRCIQKIRDKNGVVQEYEVADFNQEHRIVSKEVLKAAIESGQLSVVNLRLTKDGKLVNRSTEAEAQLMAKLTRNEITQADINAKANADLLGLSASVVDGIAKISPNAPSVLITADVKALDSFIDFTNQNVTFIGNNPVERLHPTYRAREVIIKNPTIVTGLYNHEIMSPIIKLSVDNTDSKILDIIFKTYKTDSAGNYHFFNNSVAFKKLQIIIIDRATLNIEEALDKMRKILARQKPSSKNDRRCYDLLAYLRLMYSMYISYADERFIDGAEIYIDEFQIKTHRLCGYNEYVDFLAKTSESSEELINNIQNRVLLRGF